jgi:hypothetical protein
VVIANRDETFRELLAEHCTDKTIIDLVRIYKPGPAFKGTYYGIYW